MAKYKFTVELKDGKKAFVFFNSENFYDAQKKSSSMISTLLQKGCQILKTNLAEKKEEEYKNGKRTEKIKHQYAG